MASADPDRTAPAADAAAGTLSLLAALQRDTSRRPRRGRGAAQAPDPALWSAFGSAATDRQRINLVLRLPGEDSDRFHHAGEILAAADGATGGDAPLPDRAQRLAPALRAMLEAAESTLRWHRVRVYLGPGSAPVREREDCIVLEWKRNAVRDAAAIEVIRVDDFTGGSWTGPQRTGDARYVLAAQSMMAACARLRGLVLELQPAGGRLAASIRTFEPA